MRITVTFILDQFIHESDGRSHPSSSITALNFPSSFYPVKQIKSGRSGYDQNLCGYHWSMCVFYDMDNNENWKMEDDDED